MKLAVVTGASQGIGFETARQLAHHGHDLAVVARRGDALREAATRIGAETGRDVDPVQADLESQDGVRALARSLDERYPRIDVLVNNAGIFPGRRRETADGVERCLAVNYLAPYLLTRLLLPALGSARQGRVVNVSSVAQARGRIELDDLTLARGYGRLRAYDQSKLALVLFTFELARRVDPASVSANVVEPGWVRTAQTRQLGPYWVFNLLGRPMQSSPREGAGSSVRAAADPDLAGVSGRLLGSGGSFARANPVAYDRELGRRLWVASERLVGLAAAREVAA
jgi:NAD(P)-dependent dehydrogenase (short-subunit alcohol dehydrogenase family)